MNIKNASILIGAIAILTAAIVARTQAQADALPPGVTEENWIPLSDSVGIVIAGLREAPSRQLLTDPRYSEYANVGAVPITQYGSGVVMARVGGEWVIFENLTALPFRAYPLH